MTPAQFREASAPTNQTIKQEIKMNLTKTQAKVLQAFWHKSRRAFIPCTSLDVANRTGVTPNTAAKAVGQLSAEGILNDVTNNAFTIYDLTAKGRNLVLDVTQ